MNVLIVSLYPLERNTSVAISSFGIIDGLIELGHKVSILMPNWPSEETSYNNKNKIRIFRIPGNELKPATNLIQRKLRSHFDILGVTRGYLKNVKSVCLPDEYFDILISFSDPKTSHVFTKKLIEKKHIHYGRWIQHWGDPIIGDFTRHYWWPKWAIKLYERGLVKCSTKAVHVTPFTYQLLFNEYPEINRKLAFVPLPAEMAAKVENVKSNILRVSYLGDYNPSIRNLKPLYDACVNRHGIQLTIAGYGPKYPNCDNVTILPRIPQQQAQLIENESDVLVCVCNIIGTMIPGKIMYKASSNKHILVAVEDYNYAEMKQYLESYNRFFICKNTKESILSALSTISEADKSYSTPNKLLPVNVAQQIIQ